MDAKCHKRHRGTLREIHKTRLLVQAPIAREANHRNVLCLGCDLLTDPRSPPHRQLPFTSPPSPRYPLLISPEYRDMTPEQFVAKWANTTLSEKASAHEHFIDLCNLIGHPTPASDPTGQDYTFEKPVHPIAAASRGSKGNLGYVDVWKRGHFAWEYKRKGKYKDLTEAYRQLYQYLDDLDNPPLSIVCDINTTLIHTHFTGFPKRKITSLFTPGLVAIHEVCDN